MRSRLSIAGNPVQPLLLMFPLGLFAVAVICDVFRLAGAPAMIGTLGYWNVVAALLGGGAATLAGGVDMALTRDARPAGDALRLLADLGALVLLAVITLVRLRTQDRVAGAGLLVVEVVALVVAVFAAWLGGRLRRPAAGDSSVRTGSSTGHEVMLTPVRHGGLVDPVRHRGGGLRTGTTPHRSGFTLFP